MSKYGYCRIANGDTERFTEQEQLMKEEFCDEIWLEVSKATSLKDSISLNELLQRLEKDDILVISSLDRLSPRLSVVHDILLELFTKGVDLHSLDTGLLCDDFTKRVFLNGFKSAMMVERVRHIEQRMEAKRIMKKREGARPEGRPIKYTLEQLDHAMELLQTKSFNQVAEETNISRSTLFRESKRRKLSEEIESK